jgi:hypothetical protein
MSRQSLLAPCLWNPCAVCEQVGDYLPSGSRHSLIAHPPSAVFRTAFPRKPIRTGALSGFSTFPPRLLLLL